MKKRRKLKKQVWVLLVVVLFLAIGGYAGKKIYDEAQYKKTNEYKLLQIGYSLEEIEKLEKTLDEKTFNNLLGQEKNEFLLKVIDEKYYIKDNLDRYLAFYTEHSDYNSTRIVSLVNTNNDYQYYDHDIDSNVKDDNLIIVNKFYHLSSDYAPDDLVDVSNQYYYGDGHKIRKVAYEAFKDMWSEANKEGIYLIINSSYRDFNEQKEVYDDYKDANGTTYADSIAARPGYSEHQTGLSLDIFSKDALNGDAFKVSKAYTWLVNNAHKYGFIERYKEDTVELTGFAPESWHWRYVGVDAATYIHDNNITFDEYYAYFIAK